MMESHPSLAMMEHVSICSTGQKYFSKEEIIKKNQVELQTQERILKSKNELISKKEEEINHLKKMPAEDIQAIQDEVTSKEEVLNK